MKAYLDKNGFAHLRKSKNRFYIGEFLNEAEEEENVDILLSSKLRKQVCTALSKAKVERCIITEVKHGY